MASRRQSIEAQVELINKFIMDEIQKRKTNGLTNDILSSFIQFKRPDGTLFSDADVQTMAMTLLSMGHENISTTLAWALCFLAEHQDIQEKVRAECCSILIPGVQPTKDQLAELKLLSTIFHEATRLYPSVAVVTRISDQDHVICGYHVPKNQEILIPIYALQRDQSQWGKSADEFNPERFFGQTPDYPYLMPFGGKARLCIGRELSMVEAKMIISGLLLKFSVHPKPNSNQTSLYLYELIKPLFNLNLYQTEW